MLCPSGCAPLAMDDMPTKFDPDRHHRRSIRLKNYDYTQAGYYYVTVCTRNRECIFGEIVGGVMHLSEAGRIMQECWDELPNHHSGVRLDAFVVMPNHVHGIVVLYDDGIRSAVGAQHAVPLQHSQQYNVRPGSLGAILRSFKSAATKRVNERHGVPGTPIWQRNYYEHVVRNELQLDFIRTYIVNNPSNWQNDIENPLNSVV